jgi:hypothetical protein
VRMWGYSCFTPLLMLEMGLCPQAKFIVSQKFIKMKLSFFKSKTGNWICPTVNADGETVLIVANGELTQKQITVALENGEGRLTESDRGKSLLIGFAGGETLEVTAKAVKGQTATAAVEVEIEEV